MKRILEFIDRHNIDMMILLAVIFIAVMVAAQTELSP